MVERTLSMREAQGSIPCSSTFDKKKQKKIKKNKKSNKIKKKQKSTSGEDRTHANKVDQNLSLAP